MTWEGHYYTHTALPTRPLFKRLSHFHMQLLLLLLLLPNQQRKRRGAMCTVTGVTIKQNSLVFRIFPGNFFHPPPLPVFPPAVVEAVGSH